MESTRELLGENPDISCYAKLLTGGLVPMSATIATERVFESFRGAKVCTGALFSGHPKTCQESLRDGRPRSCGSK